MACTCQLCGCAYKIDVWVPDDLWEQEIKPRGAASGGGLVCGACIMQILERRDQHEAFVLQRG